MTAQHRGATEAREAGCAIDYVAATYRKPTSKGRAATMSPAMLQRLDGWRKHEWHGVERMRVDRLLRYLVGAAIGKIPEGRN